MMNTTTKKAPDLINVEARLRKVETKISELPTLARINRIPGMAMSEGIKKLQKEAARLHERFALTLMRITVATEVSFCVRHKASQMQSDNMNRAILFVMDLPDEWWIEQSKKPSNTQVIRDLEGVLVDEGMTVKQWAQVVLDRFEQQVM